MQKSPIHPFSATIMAWYVEHQRELPWRQTKDPYAIWLSEIILQQTRVAQGLPYYERLLAAFPTVRDLAEAPEASLLRLWQGLGYYSRARNLQKAAQMVVREFSGSFPQTYDQIIRLPGVGPYTAAAIASFAFNEAKAVVDGNVYRVLSRVFAVETDIASSAARGVFTSLAQSLIPSQDPATFNQAIMEFGALQCVPKSPNCEACIFNESCAALQKKKVDQLPVKLKKLKVRNRFFNYLIFSDEAENTIIQKRTDKGIWHNLYEFPLIESEKEEDFKTISKQIQNDFQYLNILTIGEENSKSIIHKLSHQHLHIKFWNVKVGETLPNGINKTDLKTYPFPIVLHNFIEAN